MVGLYGLSAWGLSAWGIGLCWSLLLSSSTGSFQPHAVVADHVDLVEVNHYHDEQGRHVFDQMIFYDWNPHQRRFHVRAWRLIKEPTQVPRLDSRRNVWRVVWHDAGVLREVTADSHRETWTQYDPELINREHLAQDHRRELSRATP